MLGGLGRGAATGAVYGLVVVIVMSFVDPLDRHVLAGVLLIGSWAAIYGAVVACLPGCAGGLLLALAAGLRLPRPGLVALGVVYGLVLGFFCTDLLHAVLHDGPTLDQRGDVLVFRIGPGVAGALGAAWQAARTPLPSVDSLRTSGPSALVRPRSAASDSVSGTTESSTHEEQL
jgi:hypothetical protein